MTQAHDLRPAIWSVIRRLGAQGQVFDVLRIRGELRGATRRERILDYCKALQAAGYLVPAETPDGAPGWQLLRDPGLEAPRVRRDGTQVLMGSGREAMWRAMRVLGSFSVAELVATASTERWQIAAGEARTYCARLAHAGFLLRAGRADSARYTLPVSRYTGPRPPQVRRHGKLIWDPNTGRLYAPDGTLLETTTHGR